MTDVDITMPQLGETVADGTVSRWLAAEGDRVEADEPVLEVSTDKVDTEVVAPASGTLGRIVVPEGETVDVGTVLASIVPVSVEPSPSAGPVAASGSAERDADLTEEGPAAAQRTPAPSDPAPSDAASSDPASSDPAPSDPAGGLNGATLRTGRRQGRGAGPRHRHSPRVRRLAREHGVGLDDLHGAGPHGRVTPTQVLEVARSAESSRSVEPSPSAEPSRSVDPVETAAPRSRPDGPDHRGRRVERLSRRRRVIAERMHRSLQESAQLTTVVEVDLTRVAQARERMKGDFRARYGVPISVLAFVAEAAVTALGEHPVVQAELDLDAGTVAYPRSVDLGVAVDTEEGLVVPVVRGADDLSVGGLARRIAELAARSRDGSATADDYRGGTFTITNTGSRGALFDTPILNAPQVAILGLGATVRRPVAVRGADGEELIAVRSMAYLSLTYDHRLVDGADAARYLQTVKDLLERTDRDLDGVAR